MALLAECPPCHERQSEKTGCAHAVLVWEKQSGEIGPSIGWKFFTTGNKKLDCDSDTKELRPGGFRRDLVTPP